MYSSILLQAAGGSAIPQIVLMVGMVLVFYFIMYLPNQKKKKAQQTFMDEIKKGQTVVTLGGMHGKILSTSEHTVTLEIDKGVKVVFEKGSISKENTELANKPAEEKK